MSPNSSTSSSEAARRFLAVFLGVVALGCTLVVGLNALIDPWWFFAQANPLNRVQEDVDERAQKTNWLEARKGEFDAVLIGSSRASYIDRHDFAPLKLFNYAVNAMTPREYQPYLDHFAAVNGRGGGFRGQLRGLAGDLGVVLHPIAAVGAAGAARAAALGLLGGGRAVGGRGAGAAGPFPAQQGW